MQFPGHQGPSPVGATPAGMSGTSQQGYSTMPQPVYGGNYRSIASTDSATLSVVRNLYGKANPWADVCLAIIRSAPTPHSNLDSVGCNWLQVDRPIGLVVLVRR